FEQTARSFAPRGRTIRSRSPVAPRPANGAAGKRDSLAAPPAGEPASQDGCPSGASLTRRPVRCQGRAEGQGQRGRKAAGRALGKAGGTGYEPGGRNKFPTALATRRRE